MFQCTFITCMGKGILPLRYNDIKKLRVKILLWMETVTHMSYWCSHFIDLVVKEHAHKTSELLILFYGEMSGKFGKPSGDSRRAFGHCRKTHREHSESLRVILGEYSDIVVKRILNNARISRRLQILELRGLTGMLTRQRGLINMQTKE